MRCFVIDFEGYPKKNRFIFKEFSLINVATLEFKHTFIKCSDCYKYDRQARWLYKHYHKIPLKYGDISFTSFKKFFQTYLCSSDTILLVKGEQKRKILSSLFNFDNIQNLEDLGCPKVQDIHNPFGNRCLFKPHNSTDEYHCSFKKAQAFLFWFSCNYAKIEKANELFAFTKRLSPANVKSDNRKC
jgi:hypothetical protein